MATKKTPTPDPFASGPTINRPEAWRTIPGEGEPGPRTRGPIIVGKVGEPSRIDPAKILAAVDRAHEERWSRYAAAGARAAKANPKDAAGARDAAVRRMIIADAIHDGRTFATKPSGVPEAEQDELERDALLHRRRLAEAYRLAGPSFLAEIGPAFEALVRAARIEREFGAAGISAILQPVRNEAGTEYLFEDDKPPLAEARDARRAVELLLDEIRKSITPPPAHKRVPWLKLAALLPEYDALPRDEKSDFRKEKARDLGMTPATFEKDLKRARARLGEKPLRTKPA